LANVKKNLLLWNSLAKWSQTWHSWSLGVSLSKLCQTAPSSIQDGCCFFKVMIISLWNLLQHHSIVRWAIQAQWAEPLVYCLFLYVWPFEIQLLRGEGWDPINRFNSAIFLCLSKLRT
jgi:hypothetical protein